MLKVATRLEMVNHNFYLVFIVCLYLGTCVEWEYCRMVGFTLLELLLTKASKHLCYKSQVSVFTLKIAQSVSHVWCCMLVGAATDLQSNLLLNLFNPSLWIYS